MDAEPTEHLSTRLKASAKAILEEGARRQGKGLSWLAGRVLEDYANWLAEQDPSLKRKGKK